MSRRWMLNIGLVLAILFALGIVAYLGAAGGDDSEGAIVGPLGSTTSQDSTMAVESGAVSEDALEEPVPLDTVEVLFDLIEASGAEPKPEETYTVEFIKDTDHARVSGVFGDGESMTFSFSLGEDGTWQLEG